MKRVLKTVYILAMGVILSPLCTVSVHAERISDIRNTKHNFSATVIPLLPDGAVRTAESTSESQICAFCHTPHAANIVPKMPLWNRKLSSATYIPYSSSSIDATDLGQPGGKSKLCLSCHDGTLALGAVNVLNGQKMPTIDVQGTGPGGTIPEGNGATTGYTRKLGIDLTNDHPISFTFDSAQAARDGELVDPALVSHVGNRVRGEKAPTLPLEDNKVECITCHDPHVRDSSGESVKFLRVNRFQKVAAPTEGRFDSRTDIVCLACHDKKGWANSSHANPLVGNETYQDSAAQLREFPKNTQVWQAACLNCHDPHTVQGSKRLLREGTDGAVIVRNGAKLKVGGNFAIEETCYACHSRDGDVLVGQDVRPGSEVPDIKTDFTTLARHMPIASSDQPAHEQVHAIGNPAVPGGKPTPGDGKDFIEAASNLGKGDLSKRHVECTDCHNPHRVIQNRLFNANPVVPDGQGTHNHTAAQLTQAGMPYHTNIASGVLRGTWGVEPSGWPTTEFMQQPTTFDVKRGDPGVGGSTDVNSSYFTREYQLCFKCHSNYAYNSPPVLGSFTGGTPPNTNSMLQYTNQAMEYQSPDTHKGEGTAPTSSGAFVGTPAGQAYTVDFQNNNHRAWHPVMKETGRTIAVRVPSGSGSPNLWRDPFNMGVGVQTMYCTDCHGSNTPTGTAVPIGGDLGNAWGPHGSSNDFLLKGPWNSETGNTGTENNLCFKCHEYAQYGDINTVAALQSGFKPIGSQPVGCLAGIGFGGLTRAASNLHLGHRQATGNFRCTYCHIAVPHGWKNKNFLANLNDVGLEVGLAPGTQVRNNTQSRYYQGPYYNGSVLKVKTFQQSGQWTEFSCGSAGAPGNGITGMSWMNGFGGETCSGLP